MKLLPILLIFGGELIVKSGSSAADPVGSRWAAVLTQAAVRQVQHGVALIGLQAGGRDQA